MDNTGRKTHGKSKKTISRFLIGIVVVLLVIVVGAIALFWNELQIVEADSNFASWFRPTSFTKSGYTFSVGKRIIEPLTNLCLLEEYNAYNK